MPTRILMLDRRFARLAAAACAWVVAVMPAAAAPKTGACCLPTGACVIVTSSNCAAQGGTYRGNNTTCATPCPSPTGSCCLPSGTCSVLTQAQCTAQGGTYRGNNTTCATPCPAPTAACCAASGACTIQTQAQCSAAGGTWRSGVTSCSPNPCPIVFSGHGVLAQSTKDFTCVRFESDAGGSYILTNRGSSDVGDRVYVEGTIPQTVAMPCEGFLLARIDVTFIRPGFAGVGTIINVGGNLRLQTDDGRQYGLQNTGGFAAGTRVFTRGYVDTALTPARISANTIGAPFVSFGRLLGAPANRQFRSASNGQVYQLDGVGSFNSFASDYFYVEGIAGPGNTVTSADARRAFSTSGTVVDAGGGVQAFLADNILFNDQFSVAGLGAYPLGARVYVRGQAPGDYDYGETRADQAVRLATIATAGFAFGPLNLAAKTVTDIDTLTVVSLEDTGAFFDGEFVYIAGEVASTGPGVMSLSHNLTLLGLELNGDLLNGFECTPLFRGSGGGYFVLENLGGFAVGANVTVRGGIDRRAAPCDFDAFVNNSIIPGLPER